MLASNLHVIFYSFHGYQSTLGLCHIDVGDSSGSVYSKAYLGLLDPVLEQWPNHLPRYQHGPVTWVCAVYLIRVRIICKKRLRLHQQPRFSWVSSLLGCEAMLHKTGSDCYDSHRREGFFLAQAECSMQPCRSNLLSQIHGY